ncbi:MAG: hypothetical protein JXQ76_09105 [Campylobacterales bacterium]|nr:hypothetical protein [Campylobacterales bacterium]
MKIQKLFIILLLLSTTLFSASHPCSTNAITQAKKILSFHTDGDERATVEPNAKQLLSLSNPMDKNQKFIVLEVMGYVHKGQYRMRLLYYPMGNECVLMGQEILELAKL